MQALLDTGADQLVISECLASLLRLGAVGSEPTNTVSGTAHHRLYKATIVFPAVNGSGQRTFRYQKLVEGNLTHNEFDLVVGRSILQHGVLLTVERKFFFWIDADLPTEPR